MAERIRLCYTTDLADRIDPPELASKGIEPVAVPLVLMRCRAPAAELPVAQVFLISAAALTARGGPSDSPTVATAVRRLAHGVAGQRYGPSAIVLVGAEDELEPWRWLTSVSTDEPPSAAGLAALARAALHAACLEGALAAAQEAAASQSIALRSCESAVNELQRIGIALSTERDLDALQEMILSKARELTHADAGSLYLVETRPSGDRVLRFKLAQNDSVPPEPYRSATMALSRESLAGYVAVTGEVLRLDNVYELPAGVSYLFNPAFDRRTGYRSRSMLMVPMLDHEREIVGVIQLINRKRDLATRLDSAATVGREVIPFDDACETLLRTFASQAAIALDNQQLIADIEELFDGFVRASVQAIESRDPTTFGHSLRVATLSAALAENVNRSSWAQAANLALSPARIRELQYAALLHDFGKVGVREHVLVKAKKLYPWQLAVIDQRFATVRALLVARHLRDDVDYLLVHGEQPYRMAQAAREAALAAALAALENDLAFVHQVNEPTVLEEQRAQELAQLSTRRYRDLDGVERLLLEPDETVMLSIAKGSLNEVERREIESHVSHTVRFLNLIPWTKDLRYVARIAGAHHEKLDGSGYPHRLTGDQIPLQSRIMTVADIYDAVTAADRPYKRAVSVDAALGILAHEAERGMLDRRLVDLFIEHRIYEQLARRNQETAGAPALVGASGPADDLPSTVDGAPPLVGAGSVYA